MTAGCFFQLGGSRTTLSTPDDSVTSLGMQHSLVCKCAAAPPADTMPDVLLSRASMCFLAAGAAGTSEAFGLKAPSIHLHMQQQQQPTFAAGQQPRLLGRIGISASLFCPQH
jgi:hypothetical protein